MGLIAKNEVGEKGVIPAGTHIARCCGVIDLGRQYSEKFGRWANKIMVQFELPGDLTDDGRPAVISKTYTLSLNDKASLRKDLESWLGRAITVTEEHDGFPLGSMVGAACLLSILHGENAEKAYAYVAGVMRVPEGMAVPDAVSPVVLYDINNGEDAVYAKLPDWVKNVIQQSKEFKGREKPAGPSAHQ
ncbi:MAG: phage replication initiation protein, NGO0469 family [Candidatus Cryosericum sp.]